MAGQLATASFDHQHPQAPDNRMQRPNLNARNEISPWIRWEGMQVYVVQEQKTYQLVGGTGNEHWQEIAAGIGASNFVGQFPTFDDLPGSGSPGDYAYVGTGDDFVQYNWDQIAGEWRLNSAETKVSDEDFFLGRVPSEPDRVMFSMRRNSIIYSTGGTQSISPDRMANYIFTGENVTLENVNYDTEGNEEFHITNRTGSNLTILGTGNFASGLTIPAGHMASFKSSNDGWVQSFVNEEVTFSDTLDSVNARISRGPDGKDVLSWIFDRNTGSEVQFKEFDGTPELLDGVVFVEFKEKYFKRVLQGPLNPEIYGYVGDGVTDDTLAIQKAIDIVNAMGGGVVMLPEASTGLVYSQGSTQFNNAVTGNTLNHDYALKIKDNVKIDLNGSTIRLADNQNCAIILNDKMLYDQGRNVQLQIINGVIDSNIGNQGTPGGSTLITGIFFVNASGVYLDQLKFINSGDRSLRLHGIDFLRVGYLHSDSSQGSAFELGTYSPNQAWEGRVRYSHIDTMIAENAIDTGTSQGNSIAACMYHSTFNVIQANKCGGGIKIQDGSEYITISKVIFQGPTGDEIDAPNNYSNNSGLKIQGGTFLDSPPKYITVGEAIAEYQGGSGLYLDHCEDITVGSYIGKWNGGLGDRGDAWINNCNRVHVGSIKSLYAGSLGVALRATGFGVTIGEITVLNPASVGPDLSGVQILGGEYYINTVIAVDDRGIPKMTHGFDVAGTGSTGYLNFLSTAGYNTNPTRENSPNFKISRSIINNVDTLKATILVLESLEIGSLTEGNNQIGITAKSFSNIAASVESVEGVGIQAISRNATASYGASRSGRGGHFMQSFSTEGNITNPVLDVRRSLSTDGIIYAPLIFGNDQANTPGARNNPLVDLRWDNVTKFRINNKGFIDIGNVRENRIENATNPEFASADRDKYIRFTGPSGNVTIIPDRFDADNELQGEIEGGSKTFVAGAGVTLRYPSGGTNVAPTNSRFFIKFKSPNDAQLTIVPSTIPENTYDTFIPAINGSTSNPTVSYTDRFGDYALIDKLCHFELRLNWESLSGGTGNIRIPLPVARLRNYANGGPAIAVLTGLTTSPPVYACYIGFNNIGFMNSAGNEISVSDLESEGVIALSGTYIIGE